MIAASEFGIVLLSCKNYSTAMSKSYVRLGTQVSIPDDEEVIKRHVPVHEQKAVDERGRRRFHGAFTGGFSAGCGAHAQCSC